MPIPIAALGTTPPRHPSLFPETRHALADLRVASDQSAAAERVLRGELDRTAAAGHPRVPAIVDAYSSAAREADRDLRRAALRYATACLRAAGESGTSSACVLLDQMAGEV